MGWWPCPTCCGCPRKCTACLDRIYPPSLNIAIAGLIDATCKCSGANGIWNIPYRGCEIGGIRGQRVYAATYHDTFALDICDDDVRILCNIQWRCYDPWGQGLRKSILVTAGGIIWNPGNQWSNTWSLTELGPEPYNCEAFLNKDVPLLYDSALGCDAVASIAKVTAA